MSPAIETCIQLGRYQLLEELGRGAMGVVYKAHDLYLDRAVAVKVVLTGASTDIDAMQARLHREARAASRVSHPNIATLYDVSQHDGTPFLVMELVEGGSLENLMRRGQPPDGNKALSLLRQVADALDCLHARNIVHRDLKPGNILISAAGDAKLADFGIARIACDPALTRTGIVLGTPRYMSPEQVEGEAAVPQSDQYALATMAYELLTGIRPLRGVNTLELLAQIAKTDPDTRHLRRPGLPEKAEPVFRRALSRRPSDRYASCSDFVRELELALAPVPPPELKAKVALPLLLSAVGVLVVAIALSVILSAGSARHDKPRPAPERTGIPTPAPPAPQPHNGSPREPGPIDAPEVSRRARVGSSRTTSPIQTRTANAGHAGPHRDSKWSPPEPPETEPLVDAPPGRPAAPGNTVGDPGEPLYVRLQAERSRR